jgi:hypothetical protein
MGNFKHLMQFIPESWNTSKYNSNLFLFQEQNFISNWERINIESNCTEYLHEYLDF